MLLGRFDGDVKGDNGTCDYSVSGCGGKREIDGSVRGCGDVCGRGCGGNGEGVSDGYGRGCGDRGEKGATKKSLNQD